MSSSRSQRYMKKTKRRNLINEYEQHLQELPSVNRKLDFLIKIQSNNDPVIKNFVYDKKIQYLNYKAENVQIRKLKALIKSYSHKPVNLIFSIKCFAQNVNKKFKRFHYMVEIIISQLEDYREFCFTRTILQYFKYAYDNHMDPHDIIKSARVFINLYPESKKIYDTVTEELNFRFNHLF